MSNKTNNNIVPVILCGGSGTRLWPESRENNPKQFLRLMGAHSLLQDTMKRALNVCKVSADNLVTVTLGDLADNVRDQFAELYPDAKTQHILAEPCARDTAAAVAFAARYVQKNFGDDAVMWILPADHYIGDEDTMENAFNEALETAQKDYLVTFGIRPTRPETGYGYIKLGSSLKTDLVYNADAFVEKPNRETAQSYLDSGDFMWNSGMFMFRADSVLNQFSQHSEALLSIVDQAMQASDNAREADPALYGGITKEPFDKAIMEKSERVAVVPCNPEWSDIGSWESLWEIREKEDQGNSVSGDVFCHQTKNCLVSAQSKLIACAGVEDIVVIETEDSILIADRTNSDVMKSLVNALKDADRDEVKGLQEGGDQYAVTEVILEQGHETVVKSTASENRYMTVIAGKAVVSVSDVEKIYGIGETILVQGDLTYKIQSAGNEPLKLIDVRQNINKKSDDTSFHSIASVV